MCTENINLQYNIFTSFGQIYDKHILLTVLCIFGGQNLVWIDAILHYT